MAFCLYFLWSLDIRYQIWFHMIQHYSYSHASEG